MSTPRRHLTAAALASTVALATGAVTLGAAPVAASTTDDAEQSVATVRQRVYVQSPTDTDNDGRPDRIALDIERPEGGNLPSVIQMSPYFTGLNLPPMHNVSFDRLPQDDARRSGEDGQPGNMASKEVRDSYTAAGYASIRAYSLGTGESTGCPTTGDESETLAAKAVIDWLGGRAEAVDAGGSRVTADWSSGKAGMIGVSYNGTLPNMVASTGVEGLEAIVPVAAISNWYDYYRANGLVVAPDGYQGEDADKLATAVVRKNACSGEINALAAAQDRVTGDYSDFWASRNHLANAKKVKAAVFIMHGQDDWNVKQKHAIQWWEALGEAGAPRRMWLHSGGHDYPRRSDKDAEIQAWFDKYVKGENNGVDRKPAVEVQSPNGQWTAQDAWPHPGTRPTTMYLNSAGDTGELSTTRGESGTEEFTDQGKDSSVEDAISSGGGGWWWWMKPKKADDHHLFKSEPFERETLLSGTPEVTVRMSVENRRAANLTVGIVHYDRNGRASVVTRGWADPQNHRDISRGEKLNPGQEVDVTFTLEPKQWTFEAGSQLGVVVMSTDSNFTLQPSAGTELKLVTGEASRITLNLS